MVFGSQTIFQVLVNGPILMKPKIYIDITPKISLRVFWANDIAFIKLRWFYVNKYNPNQ